MYFAIQLIKNYMDKYLFYVLVFIQINLFSQEPQRITGSAFPYSEKPDTTYIINDKNFSEEEVLIIQTIQGILAKSKPSIYRDVGTGSSVWLNDLIENNLILPRYSFQDDFRGLLSYFKEEINGYILCDLHSNSSNIAISICGILNAIPVTEENSEIMDSLEIPLLFDARNKDYEWVLNNFSDSLNKKIITYQDTIKDLCLGDYSVFTNSLHFYKDIHSQFVDTVFSKMENNGFLLGWGEDEYQTVYKASNYSISVLPADYAYNLSFLTNFDITLTQKNHEIETQTIDEVHTVCFLMSDGDNIQWLLNWFITDERWFGNNNRGQIDIGWTISPALSELAPTAMNKIFETASNNENGKDYFIAGPSGSGYIYPESYSELESYTDMLNKYMAKSDLKIVNIIGNYFNDFYLYSFLEQPNIKGLFYYDFSNYSSHNGEIRFLNNKPVISARYNLWGGFETTKSLADKINSLPKNPYSSSGYSLIPVHNWSNSVDSILLCSQLMNENIRIVSPDKFINLIISNLNHNNINTTSYINYPNPTLDLISIEFRDKIENYISFEIYSINGKQKLNQNAIISSISNNVTKLDLNIASLKTGTYLLKINLCNKDPILSKIIKH
tara:strand:+ start:5735 stop:7573 length:1839 start_codon:yes stop_codon:yes gene_type:complete